MATIKQPRNVIEECPLSSATWEIVPKGYTHVPNPSAGDAKFCQMEMGPTGVLIHPNLIQQWGYALRLWMQI